MAIINGALEQSVNKSLETARGIDRRSANARGEQEAGGEGVRERTV